VDRQVREVLPHPVRGLAIRLLGTASVVVDADRHGAVVGANEVVGAEAVDARDETPDLALVLGERVGELAAGRVLAHRDVHETSLGSGARVSHLTRRRSSPAGSTPPRAP